MEETGSELKAIRVTSGLSLDEVSEDLNIPVIELEQIEDGSFGAFSDIYDLKRKLVEYAKYLGLNVNDVIASFNEYMFDTTSKIELQEIEDAVREKEKEDKNEEDNRIYSPYTKYYPKEKTLPYILVGIGIVLAIIFIVIWCIFQITGSNKKTSVISYVSESDNYEFTE